MGVPGSSSSGSRCSRTPRSTRRPPTGTTRATSPTTARAQLARTPDGGCSSGTATSRAPDRRGHAPGSNVADTLQGIGAIDADEQAGDRAVRRHRDDVQPRPRRARPGRLRQRPSTSRSARSRSLRGRRSRGHAPRRQRSRRRRPRRPAPSLTCPTYDRSRPTRWSSPPSRARLRSTRCGAEHRGREHRADRGRRPTPRTSHANGGWKFLASGGRMSALQPGRS